MVAAVVRCRSRCSPPTRASTAWCAPLCSHHTFLACIMPCGLLSIETIRAQFRQRSHLSAMECTRLSRTHPSTDSLCAAPGPRLRVRAGVRRGARPRISIQEVLLPLKGEALGGGLAEALDGERHRHSRRSGRLSLVTLDIHGSLLVTLKPTLWYHLSSR